MSLDSLSQISAKFDVTQKTFVIAPNATVQVLGSNPRRWLAIFSYPTTGILANQFIRAWSRDNVLDFAAATAPIRLNFKDWDVMMQGAFYVFDGGGGGTIGVTEVTWKG